MKQNLIYEITKRILDIFLSLIFLILLIPVFILISIIIKSESKGSVIFKQLRVGKNWKTFFMYKFRSMRESAEKEKEKIILLNEKKGPIFKIREDPRITRFGKFLRQTSLDELPQLYNVLIGEMSLVGPRPLPVHEMERCTSRQKKRLIVKPGITCLWQISGRSILSFRRWMALDLYYIKHRSLLLDLYILIKTIPACITGIGAW